MSSNNRKKYEEMNFVPDDGDSVYPLPTEEARGGQIFYSLDIIRDIVNEELNKRLGPQSKNRED
jgi:hypothetical protein